MLREGNWNVSVGGTLYEVFRRGNEPLTTSEEMVAPLRRYALEEGVQQYRDYYESDGEEEEFFQYMQNLSERDRIRFVECYEDSTVTAASHKAYASIPKREFNPSLSLFQNFLLDMDDFRNRVKPFVGSHG